MAVRWNTYRCSACLAISGVDCTPDEPVPISPTRSPVKSTSSRGHRLVWRMRPSNDSRPEMSAGRVGADRQPVAMTQKRAENLSPDSVSTSHRPAASSNVAAATRVPSWMWRRRSKRSTTWLRYSSISALRRHDLGPLPLQLELLRESVGVFKARDVAATAGVAVPEPGATHAVARFQRPHGETQLPQVVERVDPPEAGAYHHDVQFLRLGESVLVVPIAGSYFSVAAACRFERSGLGAGRATGREVSGGL